MNGDDNGMHLVNKNQRRASMNNLSAVTAINLPHEEAIETVGVATDSGSIQFAQDYAGLTVVFINLRGINRMLTS